jgi:IS5 family transposase
MKAPSRYIQPVACGLFDGHRRLEQIHSLGDPLAALNAVMDWTIFDPVLARIPRAEPKAPGGRPAYRPLILFKILVLQAL